MCFQFSATKLLIIPLKKCDIIYSSAWDYKYSRIEKPAKSAERDKRLAKNSHILASASSGECGTKACSYT